MRRKTGTQSSLGHLPRERASAVPHVKEHAALHGLVYRRAHLAGLVEDAAFHAVETMRENVALFHHGQHIIETVAPSVLRMDHNGQTSGIRSLARPMQGQHSRALADDAVAGEPHLDAQDEVAVLFDHAAGFVHICVLRDLELADFLRQHALRGNVELGQDASVTDVDDELAKAGEGICSG